MSMEDLFDKMMEFEIWLPDKVAEYKQIPKPIRMILVFIAFLLWFLPLFALLGIPMILMILYMAISDMAD